MNIVMMNANTLKYISLVTLTLQNAVLSLSMRYSRTRSGDIFFSSTAVFLSEIVKLLTCLVLVFYEEGKNAQRFANALHRTVIVNFMDTLKVCVPSLVYIVQNNLLYLSASHLDAATYQVTYQLKILTTAMFAVVILRKRLQNIQWVALVLLLFGIVLVQLAPTSDETKAPSLSSSSSLPSSVISDTQEEYQLRDTTDDSASPQINMKDLYTHKHHSNNGGGVVQQNRMLGLWAALGACVLSGFAGIYFEKILKGASISVWMRNVQLSLLSIPFGALMCLVNDGSAIRTKGFFHGYDLFIWYLILLQAGGGLIVAVVVKYADNILKGFATSLAIIFSCIASIYIFNFHLTLQFAFGAAIVILSIYLYSGVGTSGNGGGSGGGVQQQRNSTSGKSTPDKSTPDKSTHVIPIATTNNMTTTTRLPFTQHLSLTSLHFTPNSMGGTNNDRV